jgi:hypothetical protein
MREARERVAGDNGGSEPLKTATAAVGLLAGIVAAVYVLGGLVIGLRLLLDGFEVGSVATIVGQLPRELVVSTALLDVGLPAAILALFGIALAALLREIEKMPSNHKNNPREVAAVGAVCLVLVLPGAWLILGDGFRWGQLGALVLGWGFATLFACGAWRGIKKFGGESRSAIRLGAIGGFVALAAVIPTILLAAGIEFEEAQACTATGPLPERGGLVGEGGGQLLLATNFDDEESVVSIPSDQVTKTEYGDLSSTFVCPTPSGQEPKPAEVEAALGGHGSDAEVGLATELRPHLLFDSGERWRPIEVGIFLDERFPGGRHHEACWDPPAARCEPTGLDQLRPRADAPDYVDIHGEARRGADYASSKRHCRAPAPALDCNDGQRAVVYYRRTSHNGRWYWDYWWFLRYNNYTGPFANCNSVLCSDHEGDWEGITVITTPSLEPEVLGAIYAAHRNRVLVEGDVLPAANGHPLVFVAEGTHAGYPFRCAADCKQYEKRFGFRLPEDSHDGAVAWGGNDDEECVAERCVRPLPEVGAAADPALPRAGAWAGWRGLWGETCHRRCRSPLLQGSPRSPGLQPRFKCPWVATDQALPAHDSSGLSIARPFGDVKRQLAACAALRGGL